MKPCASHVLRTIKVLYEDDCYVAFDKPSGLLVIPTPKKEKNTLIQIVNLSHNSEIDCKLHPCHRLDRETSGVILFAKGKKNQKLLMDQFKKRAVKKTYIAFVHGRMKEKAGEIRSAIEDFDQRKYVKGARPQFSLTRYRTMAVKKLFSIVEVYPLTGRTNQIRIHFRDIGHPLLGERKYAYAKDYPLKFKRTALHARDIEWFHPVKRKRIHIHSPITSDMEEFIRRHHI